MTSMPPIHWPTVRSSGSWLAPLGPQVSRQRAGDVVGSLRAAARRAPELIVAASGLETVMEADVLVVDRRAWIAAMTQSTERIIARVAASARPQLTQPDPASLDASLRARARGAQLGAAFALLSGRILGQFDPFAASPRLLLVAPNIVTIGDALDVNTRDFAMWVCLHEQTHLVQFSNAPWLEDYLLGLITTLLEAEEDMTTLGGLCWWLSRPQGRIEGDRDLIGPGTSEALEAVTAIMSLLEGHADVMMDRAGDRVIASLGVIRQRFDQRRGRGGLAASVARLVGLDAKLAQYRDGAKFCRDVITIAGVEALNHAFSGSESLPYCHELADARAWLARVGG